MSVRYSEDFKKEVVKAYMAGDKSIHQLAVEFNVAKSSVSKWANEYREECLYTTYTTSESNDAKEIRRLNQLLNEKDKEISFLKKAAAFFAKEIDQWYIDSLSNTTMHKYMNKELNLYAVIMHSKLGYKTGKKKTTLKRFCTQIREYSLPHGIFIDTYNTLQ